MACYLAVLPVCLGQHRHAMQWTATALVPTLANQCMATGWLDTAHAGCLAVECRFEPRHAATVVTLTAQLRHKDAALLDGLMACVVARMDEAYSRDLVALLQGLRGHGHAASAELLAAVERFMLAKLPTGRMPPESVARWALHGRDLSPLRRKGACICLKKHMSGIAIHSCLHYAGYMLALWLLDTSCVAASARVLQLGTPAASRCWRHGLVGAPGRRAGAGHVPAPARLLTQSFGR
jgi:hypothetical protein